MVNNSKNFFNLLKKDLIKTNGSFNWPGILYTLAIPISLFAVVTFIRSAYLEFKNPKLFHSHDLVFSLLALTILFCKIPYFTDKPIAFAHYILLGILWFLAGTLMLLAYYEHRIKKIYF